MGGRKNLKISEEAFNELVAEKPDGVTWDFYLTKIRTVGKQENPHIPQEYKDKIE